MELNKLLDDLRHRITVGNSRPSRVDVSFIPKSREQEYRKAIENVFQEEGIRCPDIRFISTDVRTYVDQKIDDLIAEVNEKIATGEEIQIRVDFQGYENLEFSLTRLLMMRLSEVFGYAFIEGSRENVFNDDGKQIATVMKFEPASTKT